METHRHHNILAESIPEYEKEVFDSDPETDMPTRDKVEKNVSSSPSNDSSFECPSYLNEINQISFSSNLNPALSGQEKNVELHKYFMNMAIMYSKKRKNVKHQAAACIVDPNWKIVGIGHYTKNKVKSHLNNLFSFFKDKHICDDYCNHAEMNAIANRTEMNLADCTMYVTCFPCIECAKLIAQVGIRTIFYIDDNFCQTLNDDQTVAAQLLFKLSNVAYIKME